MKPVAVADEKDVNPRTVQEYLDETPIWSDGTEVTFTPMTSMQWRIWALATAGKFFEGLVVFMTGVALPLLVEEFSLGAFEKGLVGASSLFGILVGATALGGLADYWGRRRMFIIEMLLFVVFLVLLALSPDYRWVAVFLFGIGLALGCDYPTAHMVISESIPTNSRGKLVLGAFGFQAVGALAGTIIGYITLLLNPSLQAWRWMYASAVLPACIVLAGRFFITRSGHWLVARGRLKEAETELSRLLERKPPYPRSIHLRDPHAGSVQQINAGHYGVLFKRPYRRATILASVPWFLQDLSTYGIGLFTPTILATLFGAQMAHPHNLATVLHQDVQAAKGAALVDFLLIVGIMLAIWLADRVGRIRLQIVGFIGCAVGLLLASFSAGCSGPLRLVFIFSGFMLFNLMTNLGPNAMTYLLAGEVFPTHVRGKGAGFAASFAKIGAVLTAFLFPVLLKDLGTQVLLYFLTGASLLGALITWRFGIETAGVSLEQVHQPHGESVDDGS